MTILRVDPIRILQNLYNFFAENFVFDDDREWKTKMNLKEKQLYFKLKNILIKECELKNNFLNIDEEDEESTNNILSDSAHVDVRSPKNLFSESAHVDDRSPNNILLDSAHVDVRSPKDVSKL
ncbi:hypothetical protein SNEBB_007131 [Seison nebaliae]|nr:hypothetical protein SNEBB_007131 [Seison nebaliae]